MLIPVTMDANHVYRRVSDGVRVPSVTQILGDIIPGWQATEWHMQRGTAVHACAAMVAQGIEFDNDPEIDGQVAAIRRFFAEVRPVVVAVEQRVCHPTLHYAGTFDLVAFIGGEKCIVDWKASLDERAAWQLAAYAEALGDKTIKTGYGVEIRADGTYRMERWQVKKYAREWFAIRAVYAIRERLKLTERES
jgi:hypothetical protein